MAGVGDDEITLKQIAGRFTNVVYPGDKLEVRGWKQKAAATEDGRVKVDFEVVTERDGKRCMLGYAYFA